MKLNEILSENQSVNIEKVPDSGHRVSADTVAPIYGSRAQDLEMVLSITRKINTSLVLSDVLSLVLDHAIRITRAERGFIMLADSTGALQYMNGLDREGKVIHPESFQISSSVLEDVFRTGESMCVEDALHDERFEQRRSVVDLALQTILCAPLKTHDASIGVIYVDSRYIQAINRAEILRLFEILAGQAAIAIHNARLYEDLKRTYEELKEANEHIIASERMVLRGEMAAEVSHELNNILNISLLQAQSFQRAFKRDDKNGSEKLLNDLVESIRRIGSFAENLLVRSGSSVTELQELQLNEQLKKFVSFIHHLPKYRRGNIVLKCDDELPIVEANSDQLQQVLLNLTNNAIEACDHATITIATEYDFVHNMAKILVVDDGPGLDPVVKEKLFVEKITTKPNGHGFGLPICRKIIQNHRGEILVESQPGHGTKFTIFLPAH